MSPHRIPPWLNSFRVVIARAIGIVVAMVGLYYVGAFISGTHSRPPLAVITSPSPTNHPLIDPLGAAGFRIVVVATTQALSARSTSGASAARGTTTPPRGTGPGDGTGRRETGSTGTPGVTLCSLSRGASKN
jgi:hypothetical protein